MFIHLQMYKIFHFNLIFFENLKMFFWNAIVEGQMIQIFLLILTTVLFCALNKMVFFCFFLMKSFNEI
jgi:hypothetical protein